MQFLPIEPGVNRVLYRPLASAGLDSLLLPATLDQRDGRGSRLQAKAWSTNQRQACSTVSSSGRME